MPRTKKERHEICKAIFEDYMIAHKALLTAYKQEEEFKNHNYGNCARVANLFLDTSGTKEADEKNRDFLRKLSTPEGQARFSREIMSKVMSLDVSKIYSSDPDEVIDFVKENWPLMYVAFDPLTVQNLKADGTYITPELLSVYKEMELVLQDTAGPINMVISHASPEILNDEYENMGYEAMVMKIMVSFPQLMMKNRNEDTNPEPLQNFMPYGKYNDDLPVMIAGLKKLKEQGKAPATFGDLAKYKYYDETGRRIKIGEVMPLLGNGKQVRLEEKTPEEKAAVEEASKEPLPEWGELTAFLNSQFKLSERALGVKNQSLRFILVDEEPGKSKPLAMDALMKGVEEPKEKDSFDKLMWAINNSKPLSEFTPEEQKRLIGLISENKIAVYDPGMNGRNSVMLKIEGGNFVKGPAVATADLLDAAYRFFETSLRLHGSDSFSERGLNAMRQEFTEDLIERKANALIKEYGLPSKYVHFFTKSEVDPDMLNEFDFMQGDDFEAKKAALSDYLESMFEPLTKEEQDILDQEELGIEDIRGMAFRQKISVKEYIDNIRSLGTEEKIQEVKEEINEDLRAKAANPIEAEMAETMIQMKEYSFAAGTRTEMEQLLAKYIALKAVSERYEIKNGEDISLNLEKTENAERALQSIDKYAEDVYTSEPFRYLARKIPRMDMVMLSRGSDFDALNKVYDELSDMVSSRALEDPMVRLDRTLAYSDFLQTNEMFVPDKLDLHTHFNTKFANPFNLSAERTSIRTLAFGRMLERGYDAEDILDPYKLVNIKKEIGEETFEQYQIGTEENKQKIAETFMTAMEKALVYANEQLNKLDSMDPAGIVKLNDPSFFAVGNYLKDSYQELGTLISSGGFDENFKEKFERLSDEADTLTGFYTCAEKACRDVVDYSRGREASSGNANVALDNISSMEYVNRIFQKVKSDAQRSGKTFSNAIVSEFKAAPQDPNNAISRMQSVVATVSGFNRDNVRREDLNKLRAPENKKQLAKDVLSGSFAKKQKFKLAHRDSLDDPGMEADPDNYFKQFRKAAPVRNI